MIKWIFGLVGIVLVFLGMYLVYNIGVNEGLESKNVKTIETIAKESKLKDIQESNNTETNITKITTEIGTVVVATYKKGAKEVTEYYKKIDFPEMNSTTEKVESVKNYIVDFYEKGVQGAKDTYEKMTKTEEKLDNNKETK